MDQLLRKHIKYDDNLSEDARGILEYIRGEFNAFMIDNNVDLYEAE